MKMNNVLVGLFLGLLAVVQATPLPTVTQFPAKAEDDVFREAVTDGFLVNHFFTTETPERNATPHTAHQPPSDPEEELTEESTTGVFVQHGGDHDTTSSTSSPPGSTSSTDSSTSSPPGSTSSTDSSTSSPPGSTSSTAPNDATTSTTTDASTAQTSDPAPSSFHFLSTLSSDSGSGDGEGSGQDATTTSNTTPVYNTESSSAASTSMAAHIRPRLFEGVEEGSGSELTTETSAAPSTSTAFLLESQTTQQVSDSEEQGTDLMSNSTTQTGRQLPIFEPINPPSQQGTGSGTSSWIIIVGFIVGVAMLVMICVAIATREKWNGPRQVSQAETKVDSSNQQEAQEMETFLHKEGPRENGKSEYTVVPLDDLPESISSH